LDVNHGEVLGIIGNNGAGKSTLMKILSRITKPSGGYAEIHGRVGTLLEVGTGFHTQLTGRENIFLSGAVLGMARREIAAKFDEIVDFSECGYLLDTPLKRYSTGMQARLAFAVAAHLEAEILLVDEVLAVGDAAFQKKCLGKLGDVAGQGRTVLFTSHNLMAVDSLCTRAICLHNGKIVLEGCPSAVTSSYLKQWVSPSSEIIYKDPITAPGNDLIRLRRVCIRPQHGEPSDLITVRTPFLVEFEYEKLDTRVTLDLSAELLNEYDVNVFSTARLRVPAEAGGISQSSFVVPADLMNNGIYRINLAAYLGGGKDYWQDLVVFEVHDAPGGPRGTNYSFWPGTVRPNLTWVTEHIHPANASSAHAHREAGQ
jgi:lipopolysaccharide transport system ATP-binding protein